MKPTPFVSSKKPRLSLWDKLKLWRAIKDPIMLDKLKSRKLWVTMATAALASLLSSLGFDAELIEKIMTLAMTYIGAQGLADAAQNYNPVVPTK